MTSAAAAPGSSSDRSGAATDWGGVESGFGAECCASGGSDSGASSAGTISSATLGGPATLGEGPAPGTGADRGAVAGAGEDDGVGVEAILRRFGAFSFSAVSSSLPRLSSRGLSAGEEGAVLGAGG